MISGKIDAPPRFMKIALLLSVAAFLSLAGKASALTPPSVTTGSVTNITRTEATLNATVNPNGLSTTVAFQYGTSASYGSSASGGTLTGATDQPVSAILTGLSCGTVYYFNVMASNSDGTTTGSDTTFTTSACTPPSVTTGSVTNITRTEATLNATVNPNGLSTTMTFQYGTSASYGSSASGGTLTGSTDQPVSAILTGLTCGTTYYFRVKAANSDGTTKGPDTTFSTSACAPPAATTGSAANITSIGATLNATVNPNGLPATVTFKYGLTTSYGSSASGGTLAGSTDQAVSADVAGLACGTTYHFKVKATNTDGTITGSDATFSTLACAPPTATTGAASNITRTEATLNATVNPNGLSTTVTFKHGLTTSYGSSASGGTLTGSTDQAVSADVAGLACGTAYHFRVKATNSDGTTKGSDVTFSTSACAPPTVTTGSAANITRTEATLNATVNPNGVSTTVKFQYGLTTSYGSSVSGGTLVGATDQTASATLIGLTCGTTYHFRVKATNADGITKGTDVTFSTSVCVPPTAATGSATNITNTGATLNGTVNPNGLSTTVTFKHGLTTSYGSSASGGTLTGSTDQAVSADVAGLTCGTTYHFRVKATNTDGITKGTDVTFSTSVCAPPTATTGAASNITSTGATLNATVNPNGVSTTVKFQYGTTASYGSSASGGTLTGATDQAVSAMLTGLTCGTTYYFRVKATNTDGTTYGSDVTFTTSACADANTVVSPAPDFDGDGKSDILFRDAGAGQTAVWMMRGATVTSNSITSLSYDNGWGVQGIADFDGDNKYDLLWRNSMTGELVVWTMNGSAVASSATVSVNPGAYTVQGIGDFDGGGKSDILFRDAQTGETYVWFMDGAIVTNSGRTSSSAGAYTSTTGWQVHGVGDFNGDGKSDILWRNAETGKTYVWLMNGATVNSGGSTTIQAGAYSVAAGWQIQGTGDFNGDGKSDILWRSAETGQLATWLMDGKNVTTSAYATVDAGLYTSSTGLRVDAIADYDGDGKSDVLLRDAGTGQTRVWTMNGSEVTSDTATDVNPGAYTSLTGWSVMSEESIR